MAVLAQFQALALEALRAAPERFWSKADRAGGPDACWPWRGALSNSGHGQFRLGKKTEPAHRIAILLDGRDIPSGMDGDHLCRHRPCVNPRHLEVVLHKENTLRGDSPPAQNARKDRCIRGHEYSEGNTITRAKGRAGRECRACREQRERRRAPRDRSAYFKSWYDRNVRRTA